MEGNEQEVGEYIVTLNLTRQPKRGTVSVPLRGSPPLTRVAELGVAYFTVMPFLRTLILHPLERQADALVRSRSGLLFVAKTLCEAVVVARTFA